MEGRKEGNALFNDVLITFYVTVIWRRTYDKRPLSEIIKIKNPLLPLYGLLFPISSKGSFMCHPTDRIVHMELHTEQPRSYILLLHIQFKMYSVLGKK